MGEKLLVNVTVEESRVALVDGGVLSNLEIETQSLVNAKGNVYKGVVHRVNQSLQAAFVDYGAEKQGFLPLSEIHQSYYPSSLRGKRVPIQEVLREKQELMVQVVKDEIGNKGASLTTFVSLPGRYLVLMPDSGKTGISRRLPGDERKRLKDIIDGLDVPEGFGVIIRTAGTECSPQELETDLDYLKRLWDNLKERFSGRVSAGLIHHERDLTLRFLRDYATNAIDEIIIDDRGVYEEVRDFCTILMPEMRRRISHYTDPTPLFSRYQIEDQIDDVFARKIDLPSGGSVVIEQTEALVSIDVNSGRVKTEDIELTALTTNLEAAAEIARQLKLRDRGGLIVVDFIDMRSRDNIRAVEQEARDAFANDKAKVKFSRISEFGLMEISRQRLKSSLMKGSFNDCVHCGGTGKVRSVESSALYLLRRIKETVLRGTNYMHLSARMPVDVANYLLNRKRADLIDLQNESKTSINIRGEVNCAPNRAFVEILASSGRGKRPRRILLTFDLVRSDMEKRELNDIEEVLVEAAAARGVSLDENQFDRIYREIEKQMVQDAAIVEAGYELRQEQAVTQAVGAAVGEANASHAAEIAELTAPKRVGIVGWWNKLLYGDYPPPPKAAAPVAEVAEEPRPARRARPERSRRSRSGSESQGERRGRSSRSGDKGKSSRAQSSTNKPKTTEVRSEEGVLTDGEDKPKKRRRRRRRRSSGAGAEGTVNAEGVQTEGNGDTSDNETTKASEGASGVANESPSSETEATEAKPKRKRQRRRKSKAEQGASAEGDTTPRPATDSVSDGAAGASAEGAAQAAQDAGEPTSDKPARGRRRRSRSSAKSSSGAGDSGQDVKDDSAPTKGSSDGSDRPPASVAKDAAPPAAPKSIAVPKAGGVVDLRASNPSERKAAANGED